MKRWTEHRDDVDAHAAESRISAYVYGTVLVLSAVVGATPHAVESGSAIVLVAGTVVSTFLAHVLAHSIGSLIVSGRQRDSSSALRNAVPILSSGALPVVILTATALDWLPALLGQSLAALVGLVRVFGTGLVYRRLQGQITLTRAVWFGGLATLVATVAAAVKIAVSH